MIRNVIFDLDGTLSLTEHRHHFVDRKPRLWEAFFNACDEDPVNLPVAELFGHYRSSGYNIIIITGRSDAVAAKTKQWLLDYNLEPDQLHMRTSNDWRGDGVFKKEIVDKLGLTPDNTVAVFEDRDKMVAAWREWGFVCFQVASGDF